MMQEIKQNGISMDSPTEQGGQNPPEFAVKELAKQLNRDSLDTAISAAKAIQKAALNSDNPEVRIEGIRVLGEFAAIHPTSVIPSNYESLRVAQAQARDRIAAIAFGSQETQIRQEAVKALARSLDIPAVSDERHDNTIQLIAIIGATSPDGGVKNEAIATLSNYASINRWSIGGGGYVGRTAYPESQQYANAAIGVVSKPAPVAAPSPANPQ